MKKYFPFILTGVAFLTLFIALALIQPTPANGRPKLGVTNLDSLHLRDTNGTATPILRADQRGSGKILELLDGGTPVFSVNNGGSVSLTGSLSPSGGQSVSPWLAVIAPTAAPITTPVAIVNAVGANTTIFDVQDAGTSQLKALNDGGVQVAAPTAVATGVPALQVDSDGVSNLLEVRDAATPVFTVNDGGGVVGQVLRYSTANTELVQGSQTVTDTATASHGLTSVVYADCALAAVATGDAEYCIATVSGATVTLNVFQSNATPTANTAGILVRWVVIGVP